MSSREVRVMQSYVSTPPVVTHLEGHHLQHDRRFVFRANWAKPKAREGKVLFANADAELRTGGAQNLPAAEVSRRSTRPSHRRAAA
jgi:hypothetical protein